MLDLELLHKWSNSCRPLGSFFSPLGARLVIWLPSSVSSLLILIGQTVRILVKKSVLLLSVWSSQISMNT